MSVGVLGNSLVILILSILSNNGTLTAVTCGEGNFMWTMVGAAGYFLESSNLGLVLTQMVSASVTFFEAPRRRGYFKLLA